VINEGEDGQFSWEGAERLQGKLNEHKPAYCLIMYGANDIIYGLSGRTIPQLLLMIDICRANKTIPVVATLTPTAARHDYMTGTVDILNEGIRALCRDQDVLLADVSRDFTVSGLALLQSDGLHPTAEGANMMALSFYDVIE
jgi:lysophospholipase L1-like esterase